MGILSNLGIPPKPIEPIELLEEELLTNASFNQEETYKLAEDDLDFFASLAIPLVFRYFFPAVFKAVWTWLKTYVHKERDFSQLALGLPRGFGKTMVMKLFILYCIGFTKKKFILVLAENQSKANNIVADVCDMLDEPNVKAVFGDWRISLETDRLDLKKFGFRGRNVILMAGTIESIRGITLKNERPDLMLFDDIQSRVVAESQTQSETLEREMVGTAMKAKSPHGCLFIFVGNMYPTKWSILRKLKRNPNWIKFIAGGIKADGTSLWEELQPIEQLMREFQNDLSMGRPEVFYAEVLNDETASVNNLIDLSKLPSVPEIVLDEARVHAGSFIIIDPSGNKETSDQVAIGYFEVHDTKPILMDLVAERMSPGDTIREAIKFCQQYGCSLVCIEAVAYQSTLGYWFNFICTQYQIEGLNAVEVYPGRYSKNSRILGMLKSYAAGDIFVHPNLHPTVHLEITQFNPLKINNVDNILDLLTYAHKVLELYSEYIVNTTIIQSQEIGATRVWSTEDNCCF